MAKTSQRPAAFFSGRQSERFRSRTGHTRPRFFSHLLYSSEKPLLNENEESREASC